MSRRSVAVAVAALVLTGCASTAAPANPKDAAIALCRAHVTETVIKVDGWTVDSWPSDDDAEMAAASTYKLFKTTDNEKAKSEIWHVYEAVMIKKGDGQSTAVAYGCAAFVPIEMKDGSEPEGFAVFTNDNEVFPGGE